VINYFFASIKPGTLHFSGIIFYVLTTKQSFKNYIKKLFINLSVIADLKKLKDMETGTMGNSKLQEFFLDQLQDIYWAEKKLVKTLPKLEKAATTQQLKNAFSDHLSQTRNHVTRLEDVFSMIGEDADASKCAAMAGIVDEGSDIIDETEEGTAQRDVGLIFAGQKAEHYEIATYGGLVQLAKTLGYNDVANVLYQTLTEEKRADELLTQIAERNVNYKASYEPAEA
jgi:ferritin-like metal-binding protein YciE